MRSGNIGVLALKSAGSGADAQKTFAVQVSRMTTAAISGNVRLVNVGVCGGSQQQLEKIAGEMYNSTPYMYLLIYTAEDFFTNLRDFNRFRYEMSKRGIIVQQLEG